MQGPYRRIIVWALACTLGFLWLERSSLKRSLSRAPPPSIIGRSLLVGRRCPCCRRLVIYLCAPLTPVVPVSEVLQRLRASDFFEQLILIGSRATLTHVNTFDSPRNEVPVAPTSRPNRCRWPRASSSPRSI